MSEKIIKISIETHTDLLEFGKKSETFDDLIKRLLLIAKQK